MDEEWNIPLQINKEREMQGGRDTKHINKDGIYERDRDREKEREMERCKGNMVRQPCPSKRDTHGKL